MDLGGRGRRQGRYQAASTGSGLVRFSSDDRTSKLLDASASTVIHGSASVEKRAPGGALMASNAGERKRRCTNVPRRLRRGLLALLTALDP
jgi:hypothetical protein